MMVGREVKDLYPRLPADPGATLLSVRDWSFEDPANPGRRVLHDVSFDVREREIVGIAGLMGAGRTALLSSLFGAARSTVTGTLTAPGRTSTAPCRNPGEAIAAGLALVSEDRKRYGLVPEASVLENLTLATLRRFAAHGFLSQSGARRGGPGAVRLARGAGHRASPPSRGSCREATSRRSCWASGCSRRPRVLFLDEPTRGIDVGAKAEIYALIAGWPRAGTGCRARLVGPARAAGLSHRVRGPEPGTPDRGPRRGGRDPRGGHGRGHRQGLKAS